MAHPYHHAKSSVKRWGGKVEDYLPIHQWFDASKEILADFRHRALRHHAQGIFEAERVFGVTIVNSDGKTVPVRWIGEQHVREDCGGFIPSLADWLLKIRPEPWMNRADRLSLSLEEEEEAEAKKAQVPDGAECAEVCSQANRLLRQNEYNKTV